MRTYLILFALLILICPAFAQTTVYTSPEGMAITELNLYSDAPISATVDLQMQDGTTTSGEWSYQAYTILGYPFAKQASITFAGSTKTQVFVTPGSIRVSLYSSRNFTELAENRWIMGAGQSVANNIAIERFGVSSAVIGFTVNSDGAVTYTKTEQKLDVVVKNLEADTITGTLSKIMELIYSSFWTAYDFVTSLTYWLKYFFVDNLTLVLVLFLAVPMAFAAKNSRGNPERFFRQYFKTLKGFFEFILFLWRMLLESIGTIRGWFRL
jgi:hypothetical protein